MVKIGDLETALKAQQIVNYSFPGDKRRAKFVSPAKLIPTKKGYIMTTITKIPGERARAHAVEIHMEPGYQGRFKNCPHVKIDCDCLTGDTLVLTDEGWKEIRELAQPISNDLDFLPVNYIIKGRKFAGTYPYYKGRKPVYKIVLDNGQSIKATENHLFRTINISHKPIFDGPGRTYTHSERSITREWMPVSNLEIGTKIDVNDFEFEDIPQGREFWEAYFIGVLMGDGSLFNKGFPDLQLYGDKPELAEFIANADVIANTFDIKSRDGIRVAFNARAREVMARFKFKNKVSVEIKTLTDLLGYISGLAATDGGLRDYFCIDICGGEYLKNLQLDLLRFGFGDSKLQVAAKAGSETNFGTRTKDLISLSVGGESLLRMLPYLHLRSKIRDKLEKLKLKYMAKFGDKPKIACAKIISISYAGCQDVYDITVPKAKCFVANGVIVHNCMRHLFVWNFALLKHDSAILDHTNGEPPVITNPEEIPGCCVDENALIYTCTGSKQLKDIKIGDEVYTLNGIRRVIETHDMGEQSTIIITTASEKQIRVTPDHKILQYSLNTVSWLHAKHLKVGCLLVSSQIPQNIPESKDLSLPELNIAMLLNKGIELDPIINISNSETCRVRDIGVDGTPHFFANGILVSNCKHGQVALRYLLKTNPIFNPPVNPGKTDKKVVHLTNLDTTLKRLRRGKV